MKPDTFVFHDDAVAAGLDSTASTLDESEYRRRDLRTIPDALNLTPGVSIQRVGPRNERGVFIRGFEMRQVPLYIDGIPVYVPYDGYADMDRFLTYDVGEMEVAKGFSSPLYGPNALGGATNLITKAPTQPFNLDIGAGLGSGGQVHGFANTGVRGKYWAQGGFAWLSSDTFPLSGNFRPAALQPAGGRNNAYQTDYKGRVRAGWTPNARDEYTFTYASQKGQTGNPPYAGSDPVVRPRFWQWPTWDKESFYLVGNKGLVESSYVRARLYYDKFDNILRAYDNNCYCTQQLPSAFTSPYDDDTYGTSIDWGTRAGGRQTIKSSFYFKDDTHREGNVREPARSFRDQSFSIGFEDTVRFSRQASAIFGFSADRLQVLNAENFAAGVVTPFPKRTSGPRILKPRSSTRSASPRSCTSRSRERRGSRRSRTATPIAQRRREKAKGRQWKRACQSQITSPPSARTVASPPRNSRSGLA